MTNGDTVKEIRILLSEKGAIKPVTAQRLTLELMTQMYEKIEQFETQQKELAERVESLEKKSIVIWIERNPKLFIFLVVFYLLTTQVLDLQAILLRAFGI